MVKFGPSGNDELFYSEGHNSTIEVFKWLKDLNLDLYEYSFGRGILLKDDTAIKFGEEARNNNIQISVHAPYFVNLANPDEDAITKSFGYIINSLDKLILMQGEKCVVHIGSCMKLSRDEALSNVNKNLNKLMEVIDEKYRDKNIYLCPETMGKFQQIGTYKEIIDLCTMHKKLIPTFDFGHINCVLQGKLNYDEYRKIFDYSIKKLGIEKTQKIHIHFSKIEFSSKGEIKHLTLEDDKYGPQFEPLAEVIKEYNLQQATIICESKNIMAQDAKKLKTQFYTN